MRRTAYLALVTAAVTAVLMTPRPAFADDPKPGVDVRYTSDLLGVVAGGEQRKARWIGRLDLDLASETDLFGIAGAHAYADIFLLHGGGFSNREVGDAQVVSNIDAPYALRPFEAWIEAPLGRGLRAKAGLIDVNSEFDVQSVGAFFINSSFGMAADYSQSGRGGPSIFPVTAPGMIVELKRSRWTVRSGVFDAVSGDPDRPHRFLPGPLAQDGAMLALEGEMKVGNGGELQAGAWTYTNRFEKLDHVGSGRSAGAYLQYEQRLAGDEEAGQLRGWVRAGRAASDVNAIGLYLGGGMSWGTDKQMLGVAVAHARLGNAGLRMISLAGAPAHRAETVIELTASHRLSDVLTVQPDVQWVRHPSWGTTPDALVMGLRFKLHAPLFGKTTP